MPHILHLGDTVLWRGSWGSATAKPARVMRIEQTERRRDKYGRAVDSIAWVDVYAGLCTVDLDNGHWAYGDQLAPIA